MLLLLTALTTLNGVAGCGRSRQSPVAVRVGATTINDNTVNHWAKVAGLGSEVANTFGQLRGSPRERALEFLISAHWLTGEAADQGLAISDAAIMNRLQARFDAVPSGKREFEKEIASMGQTVEDVKLEIEAESAAAKLRAMVSKRARPVTQADIAEYYARNRAKFTIPGMRVTDLIEAIHGTRAAAIVLGQRLGPGARFAAKAVHERVPRETAREGAQRENAQLVNAIFAAVPGRVAGPVRFEHAWVLIVVRKVVAGKVKPLAAVREEITVRLAGMHRRLAMREFTEAYRRRWTARTSCSPAFVVQKCAQYQGPAAPEGNPFAGA
jgi:hypothetical protein